VVRVAVFLKTIGILLNQTSAGLSPFRDVTRVQVFARLGYAEKARFPRRMSALWH